MLPSLFSRTIVALFILTLLAACSDLAGDVEIVATLPSSQPIDAEDAPLPAAAPDVANGQRLYQRHCTECHGVTGNGQGALVQSGEVPPMPSFLDAAHVTQQTPAYYYNIITQGNLQQVMPPWEEAFTQQERWDVAMYVYTLHYSAEQLAAGAEQLPQPESAFSLQSDAQLAADLPVEQDRLAAAAYQRVQSLQNYDVQSGSALASEATPEATQPALESVSFSGSVVNDSAGGGVPTGLTVTLRYGNAQDGIQVRESTIDANQEFRFEDVPFVTGYQYFAVANYQDRGFVSELLPARALQADNTLTITLYETTNDPTVITITAIEMVAEELIVPEMGEGLVFTQRFFYENNSDRMFAIQPAEQDFSVSLLLQLPPGALILNDAQNPRYIVAQEQFALIDTLPVYPGEHQAEAVYFLPYESGAVFDMPVNNNFNGTVTVTLVDTPIELVGEGYTSEDINLGSEEQPLPATRYTNTLQLSPGEGVVFMLEGTMAARGGGANTLTGERLLLVVVLGGVGVLAVLVALVMWMQQRRSPNNREIQQLVDEIARLQKLHDTGQLNHDVFQQKRQALQKRLDELMKPSNS